METNLADSFMHLAMQYVQDRPLCNRLWNEIEAHYSEGTRHYHNLAHIENLIREINGVKGEIRDWNSILFAVFYHDVIYDTRRGDNEEQSADLAEQRLRTLEVPESVIQKCTELIRATKSHTQHENHDINILTDADLSILGKDSQTYLDYAQKVRMEYGHIPDHMFNMGRKGVLRRFLNMDRIYKTETFFTKYEAKARENILMEIEELL